MVFFREYTYDKLLERYALGLLLDLRGILHSEYAVQRHDESEESEGDKGVVPTEIARDERSNNRTCNDSHIEGRLVQRDSRTARLLVVLRDERYRRRIVERLTCSGGNTSHYYEVDKCKTTHCACETRKEGTKTKRQSTS